MTAESGIVPRTFDGLTVAERMLLITDGTVTPMLETIVGERIVPARVAQSVRRGDERSRALLDVPADADLLFRASELIGADSGIVYVQATTVAAPHSLPPEIWAGLVDGTEPIGRLLRRRRIETHRELLEYDGRRAFRRYQIYLGGRPALLIAENFRWAEMRGRNVPPASESSRFTS